MKPGAEISTLTFEDHVNRKAVTHLIVYLI